MNSAYEVLSDEKNILMKNVIMYNVVFNNIEYEMSYTTKEGVISLLTKEPIDNSSVKSYWGYYKTDKYISEFPYITKKELYVKYEGYIYPVLNVGVKEGEFSKFLLAVPNMSFEEGKRRGYEVDPYMYNVPYFELNRNVINQLLIKKTIIQNQDYVPENKQNSKKK